MKIILTLIFIFMFLFFSCQPKQELTLNDYLTLPVWDKEEEALNIIKEISYEDSLEDLTQNISKAGSLMLEVKDEISNITSSDDRVTELNRVQISFCTVYQELAEDFIKNQDIKAIYRLREADEIFNQFIWLLEKYGEEK
jgi:hypothetical protein